MGLAYAVSPRGGCHLRSTFYKAELSGLVDGLSLEEKVALLVDWENRLALYDCLILCRFYRDLVDWKEVGELLSLVTGMEGSREELAKVACNVVDLARNFNLREGIGPEQDCLPAPLFRPLEPGGYSLTEEEFTEMLRTYYRLRGWNRQEPSVANF